MLLVEEIGDSSRRLSKESGDPLETSTRETPIRMIFVHCCSMEMKMAKLVDRQ